MTRLLLPLTALALCTACPPVDSCEAAADHEATLLLGLGYTDFTPLDGGEMMTLEFGGQGGQHIWVGVQTTGIGLGRDLNNTQPPIVRYSLSGVPTDPAQEGVPMVVGEGTHMTEWEGNEAKAVTYGDTLFINYIDVGAFRDYQIEAVLTDACGSELRAEHLVLMPGGS